MINCFYLINANILACFQTDMLPSEEIIGRYQNKSNPYIKQTINKHMPLHYQAFVFV